MNKYSKNNDEGNLSDCRSDRLLWSCEDFLTRDHPTEVSDDKFWETMNECENALGQCKLWMKGGTV